MTSLWIGENPQRNQAKNPTGDFVRFLGEEFYKISNVDGMEPFFMSLVSSSNHWMFTASTGGLSAGRINADHALFPYYTVDKLTENSETSGAKAIFLVERGGKKSLWEPFSIRQQGIYPITRALYKNRLGTRLVFEEQNDSLGLIYRYAWGTGDRFGFIKSNWLVNTLSSPVQVELLDGLQNLLPAHVTEQTQNSFSTLLDAYKRNELDESTGLGIFTLNSTLTDLAEPSESLLCSVAWQTGLPADAFLLSTEQLDNFRSGVAVHSETETRGIRGAYFVHARIELDGKSEHSWHIAADVDQDAAAVENLKGWLDHNRDIRKSIEADIQANADALERSIASADGLQGSGSRLHDWHHAANVMFNIMRGGYFPDQYQVSKADFIEFINHHNRTLFESCPDFFRNLPATLSKQKLDQLAKLSGSPDCERLTGSYLPLFFSRRHGDPSRPWNRFSINIKHKDGSQRLDYEGNWRDIFQNWEALAYSYPEFTSNMICTFLNATTVDGYNPYRITRNGIDWETPDPKNPWANIGYWSDHQIIYLLKLLELCQKVNPDFLVNSLDRVAFSYADVPYRIKAYAEIVQDPFNTIQFDWDREEEIKRRVEQRGSDGKLVVSREGKVIHASLLEKSLTLLLAKLVNFVPGGGIWMNTQRPEWNDANNALVGKGLSVVTLAYLRRFIGFMKDLLQTSGKASFLVQTEVAGLFEALQKVFVDAFPVMMGDVDDRQRRKIMDALGQAGSDFRWGFYQKGLSNVLVSLRLEEVENFLSLVLEVVDHTLKLNRRNDGLYHSYNILHLHPETASVSFLYEMLEGQVAILSSGILDGKESLELLDGLRNGPLYRADQHSYILYPDRQVKGFVQKNQIPSSKIKDVALLAALVKAGDETLIRRDDQGIAHFAGGIHNIKDVKRILADLRDHPAYQELVEQDEGTIETLFEDLFHHDQFTGRSGTFFAYEGLGSIYWHMVSKLLLAVQETVKRTPDPSTKDKLTAHYREIRAGQCFNKPVTEYGAFPTDPYSHTPAGKGAKQPGMSGMVKEEVIARLTELGVGIENGCVAFDFQLLDRAEFLTTHSNFRYLDVSGKWDEVELPGGSLAFTICQVPVILQASNQACIQVQDQAGKQHQVDGLTLERKWSKSIFDRAGLIHHVHVLVPILTFD